MELNEQRLLKNISFRADNKNPYENIFYIIILQMLTDEDINLRHNDKTTGLFSSKLLSPNVEIELNRRLLNRTVIFLSLLEVARRQKYYSKTIIRRESSLKIVIKHLKFTPCS